MMGWLFLQDAFWAAIAAGGFAILFNVPRRALPLTVLAGATGHSIRFLLEQAGFSLELGTLAGATAVGFMGWIFAKRQRMPRAVYVIAGIIPMVPGVFAYKTLINLIQIAEMGENAGIDLLIITSVNAIKTGLILAALATGIAIPNLLFYRPKPVV